MAAVSRCLTLTQQSLHRLFLRTTPLLLLLLFTTVPAPSPVSDRHCSTRSPGQFFSTPLLLLLLILLLLTTVPASVTTPYRHCSRRARQASSLNTTSAPPPAPYNCSCLCYYSLSPLQHTPSLGRFRGNTTPLFRYFSRCYLSGYLSLPSPVLASS